MNSLKDIIINKLLLNLLEFACLDISFNFYKLQNLIENQQGFKIWSV